MRERGDLGGLVGRNLVQSIDQDAEASSASTIEFENHPRERRDLFVFGGEESYGYLGSDIVRDKDGNGAVVMFVGTVRGEHEGRKVVSLELSAYREMAEKKLGELRSKAIADFDITDAAVIHREGELAPADNIVLIAVSAPHRKDAFRACEFLIDELKEQVPIWKKETFEDGSSWVEGEKQGPMRR